MLSISNRLAKRINGDTQLVFRRTFLSNIQRFKVCDSGKFATFCRHIECSYVAACVFWIELFCQGWFDALRVEVAEHGVTVTTICPGPVHSDIQKKAATGVPGQASECFCTCAVSACFNLELQVCVSCFVMAFTSTSSPQTWCPYFRDFDRKKIRRFSICFFSVAPFVSELWRNSQHQLKRKTREYRSVCIPHCCCFGQWAGRSVDFTATCASVDLLQPIHTELEQKVSSKRYFWMLVTCERNKKYLNACVMNVLCCTKTSMSLELWGSRRAQAPEQLFTKSNVFVWWNLFLSFYVLSQYRKEAGCESNQQTPGRPGESVWSWKEGHVKPIMNVSIFSRLSFARRFSGSTEPVSSFSMFCTLKSLQLGTWLLVSGCEK